MDATEGGRSARTSRRRALAAVGTGATALAGCVGFGGSVATTTTTSTGDDLAGTIHVAGSSTVYPVTVAVGNRFSKRHPEVTVSVTPTGTGGGFENFFCPGKAPLNNASRAIREGEREACADNGVDPLALRIATDALTVVVNEDADWVDCVTPAELGAVWREDGAETWRDVNSAWPDEPLDLYGPTTASGTYDYFSEAILGDSAHRSDYEGTEQDSTIVEGVSESTYGMGYFGFAYYDQNRDAVKALAIDDGEGCVAPSLDTAKSGAYTPLSRPLFVYVDRNALSRRLIRAFCRFYVEQAATDLAADIGYVPVSDEQAAANREALAAAIDAARTDAATTDSPDE
ncbi:PstS family phosphate ABC transporter substrate-binding protein [Halorussus sp. AFM4]|uniref:PstS family phosphate ABC transporter substrate-binding protein n=1 Tax=Halorussus sp. AFM4 TaxID=3421651 RepID=UPI003EB94982